MDDLISREEAMNKILLLMKDMKLTSGDTTVWQDCIISPTEAVHALRWMPSVDAVEVIRCKYCDYYTAEERWCRRLGLCGAFGEDDFCCYGERKKE